MSGKTATDLAVETALCLSAPDRIVVTTDYHPRDLPPLARPFYSRRPPELAGDDVAMVDVLRFEAHRRAWGEDETIVLLQPSSVHPQRTQIAYKSLTEGYGMTGVRYPDKWHPDYEITKKALPASRQGLREAYRPDGLVYIIRDMERLSFRDPFSGPVLPVEGTIMLDTPEDFKEVERAFGRV